MSDRLYDPGAALERTAMAWSRTGLAVLATAAVAARLVLDAQPVRALLLAAVGIAGTAALQAVSRRRYASVGRQLWQTPEGARPTATVALRSVRAATACVVLLSALCALTAV